MENTYPYTIRNNSGEELTFVTVVKESDGDKLLVEGRVQPNCGPPMHMHRCQDECMTVVNGRMGYQIQGKEPVYIEEGESILFQRNVPHRFWNAGTEEMVMRGWVKPVNNLPFFLTALYDAMDRGKDHRPETFDGAFLLVRYASEFDMAELPGFVRKVIIPVTYFIGKLTGKYKKFRDAPEPVQGS